MNRAEVKLSNAVQVLSSRVAVSKAVLACYRPLLRNLSLEQTETVLLPALVRVVKRLPEIMLPVMEAVFQMLEVQLTDQATVLIQELLPQLRHAKETVRYGAASLSQKGKQHPHCSAGQGLPCSTHVRILKAGRESILVCAGRARQRVSWGLQQGSMTQMCWGACHQSWRLS